VDPAGGDGKAIGDEIEGLRRAIGEVNGEMLRLLGRRGQLVQRVCEAKRRAGLHLFDPDRERAMLDELVSANPGPFPDRTVRHVFRQVFQASLDLMENESREALRVSRRVGEPDLVIDAGVAKVGGAVPIIVAGPCAVEDAGQMETVAAALAARGVRLMRAGAWKPRSSPYDFQGLGVEGCRLLASAGRRHGMATVTEVVDARSADEAAALVDVLQVGSRNMSNYELLKEVGRLGRPVLLKRGLSATVEEFLLAAEYVAAAGNDRIILCERGIRTFERATRFTLDVSAVPLLLHETRLPVLVDVSHAAGRRDILAPLARAALAAGAQGVMVEVHPRPEVARSDAQQQLDLPAFDAFLAAVAPLLPRGPGGTV
jgi:3-deoxy-7-phosphoheptulonate synthase / chorismate mutase